jgi:hypothetical protein
MALNFQKICRKKEIPARHLIGENTGRIYPLFACRSKIQDGFDPIPTKVKAAKRILTSAAVRVTMADIRAPRE